jgi:hypothetical protein
MNGKEVNMRRSAVLSRRERELDAAPVRLVSSDLPAFQMRTCAHCGYQTTFRLADPAGWYTCTECGRYA